MALLMQDFGAFCGLHIWVELEDDSLQVNDQTRGFLFVKNESQEFTVSQVEIKLSIQPKGPTVFPNPIKISEIVKGRTIRETIAINVGDSKKAKYELSMVVNFNLVPETWELQALPFQVQ